VRENTGFDYDAPQQTPVTPSPKADELEILRGPVASEIAKNYPEFARRIWCKQA
jgi:glutaconate CoA-transferase subunit B